MYIIINRANLVVCITSAVKYVRQQQNGATVLSEPESASAIYAADNDAFYPLTPGNWNADSYRAVELEDVPEEVVPGYWYYSGEFFTTPEKEAEHEAALAREAAVNVSSIAFVTLAEGGQIDDVTATENASQFSPWAYPVEYKAGNIRRHEGELYRCLQDHASQEDWTPPASVSLWVKIGDPAEEWPEWAQPVGSHDAYAAGDKVTHNGARWTSDLDGNVWEPGVYGWTEYEEE